MEESLGLEARVTRAMGRELRGGRSGAERGEHYFF